MIDHSHHGPSAGHYETLWETATRVFDMFSNEFMPHAHCYLSIPGIVWGHAISDALIALAYFSIPFGLIYLVKKRDDLQFNGVFFSFAAFILFCGIGHLVDLWNIWNGAYRLSAAIRIVTAIASVATAIAFWRLMPRLIAIPSNRQLKAEVKERIRAELAAIDAKEELAILVKIRTDELRDFAYLSLGRERRAEKLKERINELCRELGRPDEYNARGEKIED